LLASICRNAWLPRMTRFMGLIVMSRMERSTLLR
jgi:hypothetical protein